MARSDGLPGAIHPFGLMTTQHRPGDALDLLLLALFATVWAARTLLVGLVALALLVARWSPAEAPAPLPAVPVPPRPEAHPLAQLAAAAMDQLQPLPVAELRRLGRAAGLPRALTHKGRRAQLLEALGGLEVALA
jgi:hypothetical protein